MLSEPINLTLHLRVDLLACDRKVDGTVLSNLQPDRPRRRTQSLRQEYEQFILQRIEEYKDQLSRAQVLGLGDEAVRDLEVGPEGQLVLTEILMLDHVDRIIKKRLRLPTFRRWREKHVNMRRAQRQPTHWGLASDTPLSEIVPLLEESDLTLVVGTQVAAVGFLVAAHDIDVLLIDQDLAGVEAAESHAAAEALAGRFQALVISLGGWFPDVNPTLVVMDPNLIATLDDTTAARVIKLLQDRTVPGGAHVVLGLPPAGGGDLVPPDRWQHHYGGWRTERSKRVGRSSWFLARRP
ncbi:MAG: hypothetical protein IID05_03765 [Gemmatimonadetes bacterium]|nr:hypothetical protein [Gemmatimonadota bacterium]